MPKSTTIDEKQNQQERKLEQEGYDAWRKEVWRKRNEQIREAQQSAFDVTSLTQVMEICGFGELGEKSGNTHMKYNVNGILFHLQNNSKNYSILSGDRASFMKGKRPGGIGALSLYRAVQELTGNQMDYPTACNSLASHVCPRTLDKDFKITEEEQQRLQAIRKANQDRIKAEREKEEKERIAKRIPAEKLPPFNEKGLRPAFRFLTETRQLPEDISSALLESRTVYPTQIEHSTRDGRAYKAYHLIAPSINIETGENFGYADITIGLDSNRTFEEQKAWVKKFAKNEGSFTDSVVPITTGTENTDTVVVTESLLDGVSYGVLEGFPDNQAIYSTAGARIPHDVISYCKKNGYKLHMALDNDIAGRRVTAGTIEECNKHGVSCSFTLPKEGRIELALDPKNPEFEEYLKNLRSHLEKIGSNEDWEVNPETQEASITVKNTRTTCRFLNEMRQSVAKNKMELERGLNKDRYPNYPHGVPKGAKDVKKARKVLDITFRNKDWNDTLRNQIELEMEQENPEQPSETVVQGELPEAPKSKSMAMQ